MEFEECDVRKSRKTALAVRRFNVGEIFIGCHSV
jgi:hypothetical protein